MKHGLRIGGICAFIGGLILVFQFPFELYFMITGFALMISGAIVGPLMENWIQVGRWPYIPVGLLGAFLILLFASILNGLFFYLAPILDQSFSSNEFWLIGIVFLSTMAIGCLPALLTGLLYGIYLRKKSRLKVQTPEDPVEQGAL